ncbi:hypothetical protein Pelo_19063 [Pelomyxa schiedti]|nr:hypothetical protein Pelo_19063 [Pelomyxa schiedti]
MDSRTSVHVIKTACHVAVAVFVRPAALCADHYLRCLILTSEPREQGRVRVLCGSTQYTGARSRITSVPGEKEAFSHPSGRNRLHATAFEKSKAGDKTKVSILEVPAGAGNAS